MIANTPPENARDPKTFTPLTNISVTRAFNTPPSTKLFKIGDGFFMSFYKMSKLSSFMNSVDQFTSATFAFYQLR